MQQVQDFISITPWTAIFQICNLLILMLLMKKFLFKPVMAMLEKRQAEIDAKYLDANTAKNQAEQMRDEYEERLASAREEADSLVQNAVKTAQKRGEDIVGDARAAATQIKQRADEDIDMQRRKAFNEVKDELSEIAVEIASKVVEREVSAKDHEAFIEEFIKNVGEAS